MDINSSVIYTAASVNKVPILAALYYYVQKGDIDLDKDITVQKEDIQDFGTGSMRYDPEGSVYSIKTLASLMIQKSDNTAAYLLANQVLTVNKIQPLINSWGLTQTDIVNNKTSNKDMDLIFEKIYSGGVANQAYTQEMLSLLSDSDFEDRIPARLPKDVKVYHKIGTEVNTIHDVGIVEHGKTKYYIGIMTTDVASEDQAAKTLADISKKVYDYMK
jgi:beta-lactamase class A